MLNCAVNWLSLTPLRSLLACTYFLSACRLLQNVSADHHHKWAELPRLTAATSVDGGDEVVMIHTCYQCVP